MDFWGQAGVVHDMGNCLALPVGRSCFRCSLEIGEKKIIERYTTTRGGTRIDVPCVPRASDEIGDFN